MSSPRKTVVVTGASQGIGAGIVARLWNAALTSSPLRARSRNPPRSRHPIVRRPRIGGHWLGRNNVPVKGVHRSLHGDP